MSAKMGFHGIFVIVLQFFLLGLFCDTVQAAKTVDVIKEIQKKLSVAERQMPDEPEEAAKDLALARQQIEELKAVDPKNPNVAVFQKKLEQLTINLRRWRRESTKKDERINQPVLAADAAAR